MSGPRRTAQNIETWKIDPEDATLYRRKPGGVESYMEIIKNPDVRKFICIEQDGSVEMILRSNP